MSDTTHPLRLGFLSFSSYLEAEASARSALEDGIELFRYAERLGYDLGSLRVRHFERGLTSPFVFMGALAQATSRIGIGTAVVPISNLTPVGLAEDAATADLLSDGRLELGIAGGILQSIPAVAAAVDEAFGLPAQAQGSGRAPWVLDRFLAGIRGEELASIPDEFRFQFTRQGEGLRVYPQSEGLIERVWYGSGTEASTVRAAKLGLNLQLSTINTTRSGQPVPAEQAAFLRAYRQVLDPSGLGVGDGISPRRASISRYVVPFTNDEEREVFIAASERHIPNVVERFAGEGWKFGTVDEVVEQLSDDAALIEARRHFETTLLVNLPSQLGPIWTKRLIEIISTEVAPALGWNAGA